MHGFMQQGGKQGVHTEHLGHLLAEMQSCSARTRARSGDGHRRAAGDRRRLRDAVATAARARRASGMRSPRCPIRRSRSCRSSSSASCAASSGMAPIRLRSSSRHADVFRLPGHRGDHDARSATRSRRPASRASGIETRLSPPWTTDWIAPEGEAQAAPRSASRRRRACDAAARIDVAGISPLRRSAAGRAVPALRVDAHALLSQFGSTACKAQYRCDACLEPFDYFKPH